MLNGRGVRCTLGLYWRSLGQFRGRRLAFGRVNVLLGLGAVLSDILLDNFGGVSGLLSGHLFHLIGLGVESLMDKLDLVVDKLPVVNVDQRS